MNISVFCSANSDIDPDFFTLTRQLGTWIGQQGHTLVYGGADLGLMECVARAVAEAGGHITGVVPQRLEQMGHASPLPDVRIYCETLSERKDLMLEHSDVAIVLPGGIGTLDEAFSMAASGTLYYHDKRVVVYNMKGFWDDMERLLEGLQHQGFIRGDYRLRIAFARTLDEVIACLP